MRPTCGKGDANRGPFGKRDTKRLYFNMFAFAERLAKHLASAMGFSKIATLPKTPLKNQRVIIYRHCCDYLFVFTFT